MTTKPKKRTLREAAAEILGANVKTKQASGEPFGAGFKRNVHIPGQKGFGGNEAEYLGGEPVDPKDNGVRAAADAAPTAVPPGTVPLGHGEDERLDLRTGKNIAGAKGTRAKVDNSGVVSEEGGEHGKFNSPTTHKIAKLGTDADDSNNPHGNGKHVVREEEEEEEEETKHVREEEEEENKHVKEDHGFEDNKENKTEAGEFTAKPVPERVKSYFKSKDAAEALKEDVKAIFQGQEGLTEDFVAKATTIFEAAVTAAAINVCETVEEQFVSEMEKISVAIQESVETRVDSYLNYMVEQWVQENEVAIEAGLKTELTEDFMAGLKALFEEHNIEIPEEKVSVVEELAEKVESLESRLNEEIEANVSLKKQISEHTKATIINTVTEGLTDTQKEKIRGLAEGVELNSDPQKFEENVKTLRESYFPSAKTTKTQDKTQLNEVVGESGQDVVQKPISTNMERYVRTLSRTKLV